MTQTAHVTAPEAVYQIFQEALRRGLELRPKTPRSRAALPHERICESLIPLRKVKELRRRIALDTANTRFAEHAGARHQEPDFTPDT